MYNTNVISTLSPGLVIVFRGIKPFEWNLCVTADSPLGRQISELNDFATFPIYESRRSQMSFYSRSLTIRTPKNHSSSPRSLN